MNHKTLTATITDDEMIEKTVELTKSFPAKYAVALGLFSAMLMADIFGEENASNEKAITYRRDCEKYSVGEHDFYMYTGGTLHEQYQVEHFKGDTLIEKRIKPNQHEAFAFILSCLADYIF